MRDAVHKGFGDPKDTTMASRWGMTRHEIYTEGFKDLPEAEKAKLSIEAYANIDRMNKVTLLPIAGHYRFNDYRRSIGIVQSYSFKDYKGPEKGFNPYRLSPHTIELLGKGKYTHHLLRYNEATGVFHAPQLEEEERKKTLDLFVMKFDFTTELQLKEDENAQLRKKIEVQSNVIKATSPTKTNEVQYLGQRNVVPPVRMDASSRQQGTSVPKSTGTTASATSTRPPKQKKYDEFGTPLYCTFCRTYAGHLATRADCEPMRIAKPAGCWNCGHPPGLPDSHLASACPNPKVPGVQWNPGYFPKPGTPNKAGMVQMRNAPRSGKIFKRTNQFSEPPNDFTTEEDADSVKLIARNISENFIAKEYPAGIKELTESIIEAKRMDEKDLADRESANNYEQDRKYREYYTEKEIAQRSFFIGNMHESLLSNFNVKGDDGELDMDVIKANIAQRLFTETKYELDPKQVRKFSTFTKKISTSTPDNPELEFTVFDLRVELYSREAILRLLDHVENFYKDVAAPMGRDIGTYPQEFLLKREINNDNWVKAKVDSNNENLTEEKKSQGTWVIGGRRGVTRPWFKKTEETLQKEREMAQKRREAALKRKASQEAGQPDKRPDTRATPNKNGPQQQEGDTDRTMNEEESVENGIPYVTNNNHV